jgi:hypothetical protein
MYYGYHDDTCKYHRETTISECDDEDRHPREERTEHRYEPENEYQYRKCEYIWKCSPAMYIADDEESYNSEYHIHECDNTLRTEY